jgi:hypothetical protein
VADTFFGVGLVLIVHNGIGHLGALLSGIRERCGHGTGAGEAGFAGKFPVAVAGFDRGPAREKPGHVDVERRWADQLGEHDEPENVSDRRASPEAREPIDQDGQDAGHDRVLCGDREEVVHGSSPVTLRSCREFCGFRLLLAA